MPSLVSSNDIPGLDKSYQTAFLLSTLLWAKSQLPSTELLTKSSTEQVEDENVLISIINSWAQITNQKLEEFWRPRSILVALSECLWKSSGRKHTLNWSKEWRWLSWLEELLHVCSTKGSTGKNSEVSPPVWNAASVRETLCNDDPTITYDVPVLQAQGQAAESEILVK